MELQNLEDLARLEYGRLLWKNPRMRDRLLRHWTDHRHPHRDRFLERRALIERVLGSPLDERGLGLELQAEGTSLRTVAREIPPVFGSFWTETSGTAGV